MLSHKKAPHSRGMSCPMCDGGACKYAEGGDVESSSTRDKNEHGVHKFNHEGAGRSAAGSYSRASVNGNTSLPKSVLHSAAKDEHRRVLHEAKGAPRPTSGRAGFAEGGGVFNPAGIDAHKKEKGVHHTHARFDRLDKGQSRAGSFNQHGLDNDAKGIHRAKLEELKSMRGDDRRNLADGGEVDSDADTELSHGLGKELMGAFESKDHKAVMSALEACVLHCMNKGDDDV